MDVEKLHHQHAAVGAMDLHQAIFGGTFHSGTLLAHLLDAGQHPHPAAGHEVFATCLKGLQPPLLVAVAFVVQASPRGIGPLSPDLIDQPLRGSLRLQLSDRLWILRRCVNGFTNEYQRVAWVVTVVGNDQASGHKLSPWQIRTSILEAPRRSVFSGGAIEKTGNNCPLGFYSSGSYCVSSPNNDWSAIQKKGNTCPLGWFSSGSYCVENR